MTQPQSLALCDNMTAWLCEPLPADVAASLQRLGRAEDVQQVAVMPDVHLSKEFCIGTVVATESLIYPGAVGCDIGCGMAALGFDATADLLDNDQSAANLLAGMYEVIPTNKHKSRRTNGASSAAIDDSGMLLPSELSDPSLAKLATRDGRLQLGTLGRGNHFVELQADTDNRLWLMLHSGSRGMGQAITHFHRYRTRTDKISDLDCLEAASESGAAYLNDVGWAIEYANANRLAIVEAVATLLHREFDVAADWSTLIHSNHNHVRQETHDGHRLWVHRKGALPAAEGQPGVIPGSMGTRSFHTCGRGEPTSLLSSSHGAGRLMSRKEASQVVCLRDFERQMDGVWYDRRRANALRDEAPAAYKNIRNVMRAQRQLTRIVRELRPLLCYKGV